MKTIKVKTPAKINLILRLLHKRPDGFHEIQSIMQAVSLYDYLTINSTSGNGEILLSGDSKLIPYDKTNIVHKACELFFKKARINNKNVDIFIQKNIPVAAGLAGGSSDAAGALRGLNETYGNPLSWDKVHEIAAQLGSDVNFCLEGGTCLATGRGEVLEPIDTPDLKIVIIKPKALGISANEAYQRYASLKNMQKFFSCHPGLDPGSQKILNQVQNDVKRKKFFANCLFINDLEKAILPHYPEVVKAKELLIKAGCKNALMSGSGPSVFGVYESEVDLSGIPEEYEVFKVHSLNNES